jgi:hypothetical protein
MLQYIRAGSFEIEPAFLFLAFEGGLNNNGFRYSNPN